MIPVPSIMIRTGPSPDGVTSILNTFHNSTQVTTGFYTNGSQGVSPPSLDVLGSQFASPPYTRNDGTLFVDPYGFTSTPPFTCSTFYAELGSSSSGLRVSAANAYSGTVNSVFPTPLAERVVVPTSSGLFQTYIRLRNRDPDISYQVYVIKNRVTGSGLCAVWVGPENIGKVTGSSSNWNLSGLISTAVVFEIRQVSVSPDTIVDYQIESKTVIFTDETFYVNPTFSEQVSVGQVIKLCFYR